MSLETKTPPLEASKFLCAANELWSQSKDLLKKPEFKIDLGIDKKEPNSNAEKKESIPITKGYVFGSKLAERVTNPVTSDKQDVKEKDDGPKEVSSMFKKYAEKVNDKVEESNTENGPSTSTDRFKATMEEFAKNSTNGVDKSEKVSITTGEEDEKSLFNTNCKFFMYNTETKKWMERGPGYVRLNTKVDQDWDDSGDDGIRLVGRITGTQKVVINSKIFSGMVLEKLSEKRLKISAQCPDSDLPQLFLLQAAPAPIENLYNWLQSYISKASINQVHISVADHQRKRKLDGPVMVSNDNEPDEHKEPTKPKKSFDNKDTTSIL